MDILRVLGSPDLEVRKKTLSLVLELVNSRNVDEVTIWLCILENTVITLSLVCSPCVHHWFALCACTIGLLSVRAPLVCSPCVHHWFAFRACTIGLLSVRAPLVCSPCVHHWFALRACTIGLLSIPFSILLLSICCRADKLQPAFSMYKSKVHQLEKHY